MALGPPVVPRPAATVVLLRHDRGTREVFLTKRAESMAFLGGYYVFPGGRVDGVDLSRDATGRLFGVDTSAFAELTNDGHDPVGFYTAAIRELFEESGVLLLCDGAGKVVSGATYRSMRDDRKLSGGAFIDAVREENLFYAGHSLVFLQLFITPAFAPIRFHTVFFRSELPDGQEAGIANREVQRALWVTPEEALERNRSGEFKMIPPTLLALRRLTDL
jgi:8-oxo-dGTP pyrophosphatase MutT (NUDIX family)